MRVVPQKFIANDGKEFDTEMDALLHEALQRALGMQQWKFSYLFRRELRDEYKHTYKECPSCHGGGVVGGGFGDPDGPRDCPTCGGSGTVIDKRPESVEAPPIPEGLQEAMAKAWSEWWAEYHRKEHHGEDPGPR